MMLNLELAKITDPAVRKCLKDIQDTINANEIITARYELLEVEVLNPSGLTSFVYEIPHSLGFIPTDVIVTKQDGASFTFMFNSFKKDKILISATGAVKFRCYLGRSGGVTV